MSIKHWVLVCGAVACLGAAKTLSAPWLEPGDPRARYAAQKLADRGHLHRTITTWPLMWSNVHNGVGRTVKGDLDAVGQARAYLRFEKDQQAKQGFRAEAQFVATNELIRVDGFDHSPQAEGEMNLDLQWQGQNWAMGVAPGYAHQPDDDEQARWDGSYLAATAKNWVIGAGAIDRWWGPGWQSSLILSNNARPLPAVWLSRNNATAPETPWLSWMGPWQFTLFTGQLEQERAVPNAKLIGMRLTLRPLAGLDIGFSRSIMLGGDGRPEDLSTVWSALIGRDNGQRDEEDPGNQLGAIDLRYGFSLGEQSMGLYVQMMGEDEAGAFPARKSWLFGIDWTTQVGSGEQQWFAEYLNTVADGVGEAGMPNITYEHSRYQTGYRYKGQNLATALEGDSEALTLGGYHFLQQGGHLQFSLTYASLKKEGNPRAQTVDDNVFYSVPRPDQKVAWATLGYSNRLLGGWLNLNMIAMDDKIEYLSGTKGPRAIEASWRYRF